MPYFLSRDRREDSASSVSSSSSKSSLSSLRAWSWRHKRTSISPSPSSQHNSSASEMISIRSEKTTTRGENRGSNGQHSRPTVESASNPYPAQRNVVVNGPEQIQQSHSNIPEDQIHEMHQIERLISTCRSARPRRRRSSAHLPDLLPPRDFTSKELRKSIKLSQPYPSSIGSVFRPEPEAGLRLETKARSRASILLTTRPIYSARRHSPLLTGRPHTAYFESELRPGSEEGGVNLVVGFAARTDQVSRMPGLERWSVGVHFRNGGLYVGGQLLADAMCRSVEQVGIGLTFSRSDGVRVEECGEKGHPSAASSVPFIDIELFLTHRGKKIGSWNLSELEIAGNMTFSGLEGNHDLYGTVGTLKEVNVDIFFDKREWKYPHVV